MAWEIENTVNNAENQADFATAIAPQWEIEDTQPMSQSVMDAEDQKTYNVPLGMDGIDAGFAIQTQHKGADKASFFGKVMTGIDIVGSSIEEVFQDFDRAVIEHAGQLTDSLILDKGLGYQRRMKRLEQWENGDWSFFGDKELSEERKKDIIQREKEHIETIRRWREKTQKFFNAGAQVMRPDEKLDSADKFFMAASSGIVSSAEAVGVSMITKNPTVAAASIAATYAALKDTEYFDKAIEAGETAENASRNAKIAASIEGGLEFVGDKLLLGVAKIKPIQQLGNKVINSSIAKLAKNAVGKTAIGKIASRHPASLWGAAVKGGFTEGTTELLQEGLGMGFENLTDVSNYSFDEILSQSLFAFGAGAIPGAGMGVVGTSIYNAKIKNDNAALKTILKENTPDLSEQELQVVADNVQETLLQQGEEYENEFNKLLRKESEIDVMPDGLTKDSLKAETRQLLKDKYGMTDEDIDRTFDIAANFIDARNGFNETYNEYFDKMDAAGYERNTADAAARLLAARAVTIARQEGVSTEEVRKRWNLTLTRQNYADFKAGKPVNDRYAARLAQIEDVLAAAPESFTEEQKAALRKGLAARARFGDLEASNFNPETAAAWFEKMGGDGAVKAINKRVQAIMGISKAQEELEAVKKSKKINPNELNPFEVLLDDKLYKKVAKIEKANKGDSLLAFIVKRGGLKDVGGDLKAMDAGKLRIGLINNKSGNSLDDIALAAWENGYFPNTQERPTINDLLEAISEELFGRPKYQYQDGNNESLIDYVDDLAEQMQILGVDYENMTADEAEQAYNAAADEYNKRRKEFEIPESEDGELFDDVLPLFQFAGENALNADMSALDQAKSMEEVGYDAELIRGQTGWFKGVDGKWRFEISDKEAKVNRDVIEEISSLDGLRAKREQLMDDIKAFKRERETNAELYADGYLDDLISKRYQEIESIDYDIDHGFVSEPKTTLGELLQHDKLYAAYPALRDITVVMKTFKDLSSGSYSRSENTIYLDSRLQDNDIKSTLMHEIQHIIQSKENFSRGGNLELAKGYRQIIKSKEAKEFHKALERKVTEAMVDQLKADNLEQSAAEEVAGAYGKYLNAIFNDDLAVEEVTKIEKGYYQLLDKLGISAERVEDAYKAIQGRDLWQEAVDETKNKLSDADAYEIYKAFAGEVEARNTQARMNMSEEERAATNPESTQDIKNADALVVFPDGSEVAYVPEKVHVENGIVDLSDAFDKAPTQKEVEDFINTAIEKGTEFNTLSADFFFDLATRSKAIKKLANDHNYKKLSSQEKKRYRKYIVALSEIAAQARQTEPLDGKLNTKTKKKPNVEKYYYFEANVRFGDKVYTLLFNAEKNKGDSENKPQTVHLYSIDEVKEGLAGRGANTRVSKVALPSLNNNIPQNENNVNNDRNLVVYHTINKNNLQKAIDFGGFPAPSLAIVNKNEPFNFGGDEDNIQLIGNKDLIDPKKGTDVYNRDVWTKTFPFATYETPTFDAARKFEKEFEKYFDKIGEQGALSSLAYVAQSNPASARDSFVNSTGAKLAYLEQTKGKEIELPQRDLSEDYLKQGDIDEQFVEEVKDLDENGDREEYLQKMSAAAKRLLDRKYDNSTSRFAQKLKKMVLEKDFDEDGILYFGVADTYTNNARRYLQTKGQKMVDFYEARDFIDKQVTDETAYRQWATKQIEDKMLGEPKVEVDGELLPFTLENVTKAMIDGATQNAQDSLVYGSGKAVAAGAKALNSIDEIKIEGKKLVTKEESQAKMEELEEDMEVFTKQFVKYDNENYFFAREAAYKALGATAAKENPTAADLQKALDYEFGEKNKYAKDLLDAGVDIAKSIRNLSRYYFEAKPQRAVGLNEFSGAIVPTSKDFDDIAQQLVNAGLRVVRSDNQKEAVKQFEDVYFQGEEKAKVNPRGAFVKRGDENIIFAFEGADASTVVHELGHFFLSDMKKFADNEKTAEQLAEIYKYLGSENGELTVEQEEKFADTFEVYLLDGRAPNQILKSVFARFKRWIGNLWAELKRIGGIEITDEVRSTFDEMFGGRSLDFSMQAATLKMGQALERGNISQWQINRAMNMLYDGKMSKAEMQTLINKLKNGMKGKEFVDALKEFENNPAKRNREALSEWDYTMLRNQLEGLNFNRDKVKNRIDKLLKWSEPRTRGGKLVGRFPNKQLNEAFDRYRELVAMEKADAQNKIQENIDLIEQQMKAGGDVDIERLIFENRLLSYGIGKISNTEMLKLYDGLAESYNMGRLTDKITGEAKRERRRQMIERAKAVLTDGGRINPNIEVSDIKQRLARFGMSQQSWSGLLDTLSVNDSSSKTNKSALSQDLDMFEAEQAKYAGVAADSESISEKLSAALKSSENPAQSVTRYINKELPKKTTLEWTGLKDPKERDPKRKKYIPFKRTFTKDQLIDIYMKAKDDDTRNIMINDPVNQYNREFLQKVDDELTSDDRAFADAVFKFYDENYTRFNAFYEAHFGMSLPKSKYYTPRAMTVDGVSIDDKSTHGYAGFSGAKKRVAEAGTAVINIQGVMSSLNKYINQQNHYMGYMDKLADINAVLANKEVKNIIGSLFGKEMNKRIEYEINNLANNGNDKIDVWGKFWNKIRANYAKSVLTVKPSLAIKQLTSFPAYWENISAPDFVAGVADFFAHPKEAIKTLGGTTLMKTRGADIIRDFDQITSGSLFNKMKRANGKIKWNDLLMANIQFGDRGAIYMGGWALYKSELKKNLAAGMSEPEAKAAALNAFERITDETQQSGRLSQQSYMQSNSALRAFTMFCSSQNQYLRKEINAVRGVLTGRMSKQQAAKTLFIYHVLLPVFFQVVSDGFRFDKDNDLRAAALGSLNGWFILNKVIENLYNLVVDEGNKMFKARMSVRDMIPFWGSVEDLKNNLLKFADDEMDAAEVIYSAIKPVGEVTGLPLKYAKDVAENAGDYAEDGEYGKELLLWLGWSPYSLMDSGE